MRDVERLPTAYWSLVRWYPRLTDRSRALGVSRQTVTAWERDPGAVMLRSRTARAVELVASVTADVEDLVGDPAGAGAWMVAPQPLANGQIPARLAGEGVLEPLRLLMLGAPISGPARRVDVRPPRVASEIPRRVPRERPRSRAEAAVLARLGEDPELIGPVVD